MGDYALPCFALAKVFRKAPNMIAEELSGQIATGDRISEVRVAGPYLNFFVPKANLVEETLSAILEQGADYGRGDRGVGKTVVIDFFASQYCEAIWHSPSAVNGDWQCSAKYLSGVGLRSGWGESSGRLGVSVCEIDSGVELLG